jgi:endonuclease/exonuclease/phosphatase (EEP) superfamily protein YafD
MLRRLAGTLALGYTALLVALQAAFSSPFQQLEWLRLIDTLGLWLYLPLPFVLCAALAARSRSALALLVPALWFGVEYGQLFAPHPAPASGSQLRVLTWNLLYINEDAATVSAAIRSERPDIVTLQELGIPMSAGLERELSGQFPYRLLAPGAGTGGLGILSRYPIEARDLDGATRQACRCQQVTVALDGRRFELINAHPPVPDFEWMALGDHDLPVGLETEAQDRVLAAVLRSVEQRKRPLLLAGDFNLTDRQPAYGLLRRSLGDAFRSGGWGLGLTFPNARSLGPLPLLPVIRIDYVFFSPEWSVGGAWNGERSVSDHRYLVADLALAGQASARLTRLPTK